jgi:hypothetical protein
MSELLTLNYKDNEYFKCLNCEEVFEPRVDWDAPEVKAPCPRCASILDLDRMDALDPEFHYMTPILMCRVCSVVFELPYFNLPQMSPIAQVLLPGENPLQLPPESWSIVFGCRACGHASEYAIADLSIGVALKWKVGSYRSGRGVYLARFPCGESHCEALSSMYIDTDNGGASEALTLLRSGIFDERQLPCGHLQKTLPEESYSVGPVLRRLW